jgi:NAD(P) transhydrogenase subunit alpha
VAGLQAIATAKRLGAVVDAFDTRAAVEEQVRSLGARFVKADLGETGETAGGYAKGLTEGQLEAQRRQMARHCAQADVVITTAQVFGHRAPTVVTRQILAAMRPGSVVVDMAVESGGNVEGSVAGGEVLLGGVCVLGFAHLARRVPQHASQMYASNLANLLEEYWDRTQGKIVLRADDEILAGCLLTQGGEVHNRVVKEMYAA